MFLSVQLASGACRNARVLLLTPPELGARSSRTWRCPKSYQYCNILYFINVVRLCQNFTQNVRTTSAPSHTADPVPADSCTHDDLTPSSGGCADIPPPRCPGTPYGQTMKIKKSMFGIFFRAFFYILEIGSPHGGRPPARPGDVHLEEGELYTVSNVTRSGCYDRYKSSQCTHSPWHVAGRPEHAWVSKGPSAAETSDFCLGTKNLQPKPYKNIPL